MVNELINLDHEVKGTNIKIKERPGMRKDRFSALEYNYMLCQELVIKEKPKKQDPYVRPPMGNDRLDSLFANAMQKEEQPKTDYQARPQPAQETFVQPKQNDPFSTRIQPREDDDIPPFLRKLRK